MNIAVQYRLVLIAVSGDVDIRVGHMSEGVVVVRAFVRLLLAHNDANFVTCAFLTTVSAQVPNLDGFAPCIVDL